MASIDSLLEVCLRHGNMLVQLGSKDEFSLEDEDGHESESENHLHANHLGINLDESDSGVPVKGLPCIAHSNTASAPNNLWNDFATEAAVEGNDGLVLVWKERSLHAAKDHVGREKDEDADEQANKTNGNKLKRDGTASLDWKATEEDRVVGVTVQAERSEESSGCQDGDLLNDSVDGSGAYDLAGSVAADNAGKGRFPGWLADHSVGPSHVDTAKENCDTNVDESVGERPGTVTGEHRGEKVEEESVEG